ncbi:MAG: carboxypeptidase-like regulatory domain-containing protein [Dysgonomonas sp.]
MKRSQTISFILVILSFLLLPIYGQNNRTIKGVVVDENLDEPLIGVSIILKGTTSGTATDIDGEFSLTLPDNNNKTLVISYLGYITQEIEIDNKSTYKIVLKESAQTLDEVVVMAYGIQTRKSLTMASTSVVREQADKKKSTSTWKRSGMADNSIRLQVGENDYIPLDAAQIAVQIDGFRVRVLMDCFFYNNKGNQLEGVFKLKLPSEATPYYFAFGETEYMNEKEWDVEDGIFNKFPYSKYELDDFNLYYQDIEDSNKRNWNHVKAARIVSKQKAAKAYEKTVSAQVDPALMEWGGADMFSCKVYPLSNNTLHRVVIGYDLNMTEALDFREYIMGLPKAETELKVDIVAYDSPAYQLDFPAKYTPNQKEGNRIYYSITNPEEKEFTIRYNNVAPVLLSYSKEYSEKINYSEELDIPYFAANYRVNLPEITQENLPTDAIFMLDLSISSNPDKFNVWLKLVDEILDKNRDIIKRFAVLTFNIETRWYNRHYLNNNYYNKERFLEYANTLALEGATDIYTALKEASNPSWLKKDKNVPKHIFLMSDADCNWGETNMHKFAAIINKGDHIHTYKTGLPGTNVSVINYLSKVSNGFAFTVTGEEEAALTAKSFRYKPWSIENIKVEGVTDFLISGQPTQLYNGQKLILTGRGVPNGNIYIDINNGSEKKQLNYNANIKINSPLVSRIYGQIATAYLENYGFHAEDAAVNYSTYYQVPGIYTSLLMLESEWDYDNFGIDTSDAKYFVEDNPVTDIIKKMEDAGIGSLLSNDKESFSRWLEKMEEGDLRLDVSDEFKKYYDQIENSKFTINLKPKTFRLYLNEQQTDIEKELLADEDIRFDNLQNIAKRRRSSYGKADAVKLLSSVVERNASDIQAIRDVAMVAIDWDMGDHAYYMMRRIVDWREGEALAYLTAAEALAKSNNIDMALVYYYICLMSDWDSDYGSFKSVAALKCIKYINELSDSTKYTITDPAKRFMQYIKNTAKTELEYEGVGDAEEADILIVVNWNINNTDIDLHVIEPSGEECYYGHRKTEIGGQLSIDVTDGYGPEMYILKNSVPGEYSILLDFYRSDRSKTASKAKAYIDIYRDWGRKNEKVTKKVIDLERLNQPSRNEEEDKKKKTVLTFKIK